MNRLLAIFVSLLLFLLILEGGLRLLGAKPLVTINQFDDRLGWTKSPSSSTRKSTSEFDVTFTINELGLRDDPGLPYEKPLDELRILIVGDSFPLGYTVERDDLFVDILEQRLKAQGRRVQVINGGTEGYSTDQYAVWLSQEGLKYDPDLVLITAYQNDIYWNSQDRYVNKDKPRLSDYYTDEDAFVLTNDPYPLIESESTSYLARKTALVGFVSKLSVGIRYGQDLVHTLPTGKFIEKENAVILKQEPSFITESWKFTRSCLQALKRIGERHKVKLALVLLPSREQTHPYYAQRFLEKFQLDKNDVDFDKPNQRIEALAREAGLAVLNPVLEFKTHDEDHNQANQEPLFFEDDWHFNPNGNNVLANWLHTELEEGGWIPTTIIPASSVQLKKTSHHRGPIWPWVLGAIWILLSGLYVKSYPDEAKWLPPLKIAALLGFVLATLWALGQCSEAGGLLEWVPTLLVLSVVVFIAVKAMPKLGIMRETWSAFVRRGHWYMLPLLVVMLTIGSLLVVAASSPLIAPFIYTLF